MAKVFVTVGSGGAFASGSADLTPEAREIMGKIATASGGDAGSIVVSGHTDNVPLMFGSPFRDNWDLAAVLLVWTSYGTIRWDQS